jgi:hypothetical protein
MVQVHAIIVNKQLQKILSVPRVSGEETKLAGVVGTVQVVLKTMYACEPAAKNRMRMICRAIF